MTSEIAINPHRALATIHCNTVNEFYGGLPLTLFPKMFENMSKERQTALRNMGCLATFGINDGQIHISCGTPEEPAPSRCAFRLAPDSNIDVRA